MMIARDRGRSLGLLVVHLALVGVFADRAEAQLRGYRPAPAPAATPVVRTDQGNVPRFELKQIPVNPTDPIAVVNQQVITRQQLADECVAREGTKILDAMVARVLIDQTLKARKLEITAAEIDIEIDQIAMKLGGGNREAWLRTLDKEKGISPAQYARDIIYPSIALRKLAVPRVQVTEADLKDAYEANYGERLHCRLIMVQHQQKAIEIWEELRKNPAAFESIAKKKSTDTATRALGGLLPEPIARHAYPRPISDAAYQQLVDGDPKDTDPTHKPKDGDITGPIQVNEGAWLIIKREQLVPGTGGDFKNPQIRQQLHAQMFDVKLKEVMSSVFEEVYKAARVENRLTGTEKLANEEKLGDSQVDGQVKPTSGAAPGRASTAPVSSAPPVGLPADAIRAVQDPRPAAAPIKK